MYNSNVNRFPTAQATVTGEAQIKETKYGDKADLGFTLANGQEVNVFDCLDENNDSILLELALGQEVTLYQNQYANWKVDKKSLTKKTVKNVLTIAPKQVKEPIDDDNNLVRKQARLLRGCVDAILIEFDGIELNDEIIQKYATSLYISMTR